MSFKVAVFTVTIGFVAGALFNTYTSELREKDLRLFQEAYRKCEDGKEKIIRENKIDISPANAYCSIKFHYTLTTSDKDIVHTYDLLNSMIYRPVNEFWKESEENKQNIAREEERKRKEIELEASLNNAR